MNLLTCILIAIPIGIIFIMLWIYNDYRKYKKKNKLAILLFLLFPTTLSAQYVLMRDAKYPLNGWRTKKGN